jgi:hypothetical protein
MTPCSLIGVTNVLEEHIASIFTSTLEMMVPICHTTQHHKPDDHNMKLECCEILKYYVR